MYRERAKKNKGIKTKGKKDPKVQEDVETEIQPEVETTEPAEN